MSKAVKKFECPVCFSRNDSESDAIKCCIENIEVVYECGACGSLADTDQDAAMCCLGDCEMVRDGKWPDYNNNANEVCK